VLGAKIALPAEAVLCSKDRLASWLCKMTPYVQVCMYWSGVCQCK